MSDAVRYPPKVVTLANITALMPWAEVEENDEGELVVYTGLRVVESDEPGEDQPLAFIDGMPEPIDSTATVT